MAGRPKKTSSSLAPLESEVMEAVWKAAGPVAVRDVLEALNASRAHPLAYTTVMTVMNRLLAKDILVRSGQPRHYLYEATALDPAGIAVREAIRIHGDAAVAYFVQEAQADPELWSRLQSVVEAIGEAG
jgi:predicted transcriptional regulator